MVVKEYKNTSNNLTISIHDYHEWKYFLVKRAIKKKFKLSKSSKIYVDCFGDVKFQDFENKDGRISIEWSIWEGLHIVALDEQSERLVYAIMEFLKNKYGNTNV